MSTRDFTRPQRPNGAHARDSERRARYERERNGRGGGDRLDGADDPYGIYRPEGNGARGGATTVGPGAPGRTLLPGGPGGPQFPGGPGRPQGPGGPGRSGPPGSRHRGGLSRRRWTLKKIATIAVIAAGVGVVGLAILIGVAYAQTPVPTAASQLALSQESTVYFGGGHHQVVGTFGTIDRRILRSDQIPPMVKNAVLAAEDRGFYHEPGVSPTGTLRAFFDDLTGHGGLQGGSTITQQFVRNYYSNIGTQQTVGRKVKEIFVALKVGRQKSKDWILTQYLNTINLGRAYGVGAAAEAYFGQPVTKLDAGQAAVLAAIIQLPNYYSTPAGHAALVARWNYVLDGMVKMGTLSPAQRAAQKFPVFIKQQLGIGTTGYRGYIMQAVQNELWDKYRISLTQLEAGGYKVETTFNRHMMDAAYRAVIQNEREMAADGARMPSYAHVGLAVVQPGTGAVVAMYSGPGTSESARACRIAHCQVDMALQSRNQVGSSFKPYVLATALQQGISIKSILNGNTPLCVPPDTQPMVNALQMPKTECYQGDRAGQGWYDVSNDTGDIGVSRPMDVTNAIAYSLNTAFVDLTHRIGTRNVIRTAQSLGVDTSPYLKQGGSGLSEDVGKTGIAIGIAPLTVEEQATTFATFANNGEYVSAHVVNKLTDGHGNVVPLKITRAQVLNPGQAADADYALSKDTVFGTGTRATMNDGREIIAKTGTTENGQAAWFVGAIPQYSAAVGMFTDSQKQTLNGVGGLPGYGGEWPAKIWHTFAENVFANLPALQFPQPVFGGQVLHLANLPKPKPKHQAQPPQPGCNPFNPFCKHRGNKSPSPCLSGVPTAGCPSPAPTNPTLPPATPTPSFSLPPTGGATTGRSSG